MSVPRIYTKKGDHGLTSIGHGTLVPKSSTIIHCVGDLDEVNAHIGYTIGLLDTTFSETREFLLRIQNIIFDIGATLSAPPTSKRTPDILKGLSAETERLESQIDRMTSMLPPLSSFILPGGNPVAAYIHVTRTAVRRAERSLIAADTQVGFEVKKYVNRLSDYLFTLARLFSVGNEVRYHSCF